jgi:hypothetical protein
MEVDLHERKSSLEIMLYKLCESSQGKFKGVCNQTSNIPISGHAFEYVSIKYGPRRAEPILFI